MKRHRKILKQPKLSKTQRLIRRQNKTLNIFRKFYSKTMSMDLELTPIDSENMPECRMSYFDFDKNNLDPSPE